jgi:hypothetical protein
MTATDYQAIRISRKCAGCGGLKHTGFELCTACFCLLPYSERKALYLSFGAGFEDAYSAALVWLKANRVKSDDAKPNLFTGSKYPD